MCSLCTGELAASNKRTLDIKYIQAVIHKCSCCCSAVQSSTWTPFVNMQIHSREISALPCFTKKCGWCTGCETIRRFAFQRQAQTHHVSSSSSCKAFTDELKEEKRGRIILACTLKGTNTANTRQNPVWAPAARMHTSMQYGDTINTISPNVWLFVINNAASISDKGRQIFSLIRSSVKDTLRKGWLK